MILFRECTDPVRELTTPENRMALIRALNDILGFKSATILAMLHGVDAEGSFTEDEIARSLRITSEEVGRLAEASRIRLVRERRFPELLAAIN